MLNHPRIPVARPQLADLDSLVPYLREVDAGRWYSNFGPLVMRLERRLAEHYRLPPDGVATVANGTLGLMLALLVQVSPAGGLCLMPAWTFVASAQAALAAGLMPYFVDVAESDWALTPAAAEAALADAPGAVAAVLPVAPFGQRLDLAGWDAFRDRTGVAVVVDAAAAFDSLVPGRVPAVVSLHATKLLAAGEGGFVASHDCELLDDLRGRTNFGFQGSREARVRAINAKLSEYGAAVGLAGLAKIADTRRRFLAVARAYRDGFARRGRVSLQPGYGETWVATTCVVRLPAAKRDAVVAHLSALGIDTRTWWGRGAQHHAAFAALPRAALPVTEVLAEATLGLPCFPDLTPGEVADICAAVEEALDRSPLETVA